MLKQVVTNSTGGAVTLVPAPLLIDRIEVLFNDGSLLGQAITGDRIWIDYATISPERWAGIAAVANTTSIWGAGASLANGASITYYVPFNCILSQAELFIGGLSGDVVVRVFPNAGVSKILESGSAVPTLSNMSLILKTKVVPAFKFAQKRAQYQAGIHDYPFLNQLNQQVTQTFNSSSTYDQVLGGIMGLVSHMFITLRSSTLAAGMRTYATTIDSFNLLDDSGQSMTGLQAIPVALNRYVDFCELFPGTLASNHAVLHYAHSEYPILSETTGSNWGCYSYCGKEQLRITTSSGHSNGTFTLDVIAFVHAMLRIEKGVVSVFKS
jgi:hypothetical protein